MIEDDIDNSCYRIQKDGVFTEEFTLHVSQPYND